MTVLSFLGWFALLALGLCNLLGLIRLNDRLTALALMKSQPPAPTATTPDALVSEEAEDDDDFLVVEPPVVPSTSGYDDTIGDFLKYHTRGKYSWNDVGAELYRRIRVDEIVVSYFTEELLQKLPVHTSHALHIVTSKGLRAKTLLWIHKVHRNVRNKHGQPITGEAYERTFLILASVLADMGVPRAAVEGLADLRDVLRLAIVAEPETV